MIGIRLKNSMAIWLRNAIAETNVFCEITLEHDVINNILDVTFKFEGYSLRFNDWELERLYDYMRENKDLSEIECAREFLKSKLKQKIKEGRRGRKL